MTDILKDVKLQRDVSAANKSYDAEFWAAVYNRIEQLEIDLRKEKHLRIAEGEALHDYIKRLKEGFRDLFMYVSRANLHYLNSNTKAMIKEME